MGLLDDTAIFTAVIQQGGFSHAAKHLGLSNGLISRRIAQLESKLGVTLIQRTTRQLQLTTEGELFWQHAQRIQQELDSAVRLIQASSKKPKGMIRISAPPYFGRFYLTPILTKFLKDFSGIEIQLLLSNQKLDPIKDQFDLIIRGAGYLDEKGLHDSSLQARLLLEEKIGLYAAPAYLLAHGELKTVNDLLHHSIINYSEHHRQPTSEAWPYAYKGKSATISLRPQFHSNDIESGLIATISGAGVGRFTMLNAKVALQKSELKPVLQMYDWGNYYLYAIYPQQKSLPHRTRLLLEFIYAHTQNLVEKIS